MVSSASRLVILILALIINRRYYLDARTAFILLCIGIKMEILNSATYSRLYTDNILPRSASANSPNIKLSHAEQYVA